MIKRIEVSLRAWHPSGSPLRPDDFSARLGIQGTGVSLAGAGQPWQAARILLCSYSAGDFAGAAEPSEAFYVALERGFSSSAGVLQGISGQSLDKIRGDGILVDLFCDLGIDQNQLELPLPAMLLVELGRLRIPLRVNTDP